MNRLELRQAKKEAGIESVKIDPDLRDDVNIRKKTKSSAPEEVFEKAEGPDSIKQDREYVRLLENGCSARSFRWFFRWFKSMDTRQCFFGFGTY
jgi:hypothetical protein